MYPPSLKRPYLIPDQGIEIIKGLTVAATCPVWFRIEPVAELVRRRWICLRYSASFFDEPIRPLIRFVTKDDTVTLPMNGAVLGSAEWVGRVPDGTVSAMICPVRRTGPFAFRLESVTAVPRTALVGRGLRQNPGRLMWAARSRLARSRQEASRALSFASSGAPMEAYAQWRTRLARPLDLGGLDVPRSDWRVGPVFRLILKLGRNDPERLRQTIRSLQAQAYPRWSLHAIADDAATDPSLLSAFREQAGGDPRLCEAVLDAGLPKPFTNTFDRNDFVAHIDAGDCLPDYALAVVAEELAREPELEIVYSDEDRMTREGDSKHPIFKTDWSPAFQQHLASVGRLTLLRAGSFNAERLQHLFVDEESAVDALSRNISRTAIRHIRRILYRRRSPTAHDPPGMTGARYRGIADPPHWPQVAVVIPTRDRAKLLAKCLAGLRDKTDYPGLEIVVVDNGSTAPDAVRLLRKIALEPRTTVLYRPGPFNFSALSNDGARATKTDVLLFLNNDVVVMERGWLKAMVRWAIKPEIGAVGAKLLFPNGLIEHAGVVLGFGGIAGHIYQRFPKDYGGYLAQLTVPREVSAVTGACMAMERSKFEAVGGFDGENLPIDLNDIDLCLRTGARGWINIWTPEARLIHRQSATRGRSTDSPALYRKERTYFVRQWSHLIRDDPCFHPGLSLYSDDVALS